MNRLTIIGNLVRDPETRTTPNDVTVCNFTVAVNRRRREGQDNPDADFFSVAAWRQLGENCAKYLKKGRKVAVVGAVSCEAYQGRDGSPKSRMNVNADEVEFLSPKETADPAEVEASANAVRTSAPPPPSGYVEVDDNDDLPF